MRIVDDIWFTSFMGIIGIVIGEDETTGERKAYIGIASGFHTEMDKRMIAANGAPFTPEIAARIATLLNPPEENKDDETILQ